MRRQEDHCDALCLQREFGAMDTSHEYFLHWFSAFVILYSLLKINGTRVETFHELFLSISRVAWKFWENERRISISCGFLRLRLTRSKIFGTYPCVCRLFRDEFLYSHGKLEEFSAKSAREDQAKMIIVFAYFWALLFLKKGGSNDLIQKF